jgi:DNA (cytosine-5)-methyltransferase 1
MRGSEIEPVDVITFGSPCQDMSLAGKRAGLDGSRSSLFYEAIRIVKEMRCKTNGKYPRYIVWENVTGAFSSNKGEDFRAVLEAVASVAEEVPKVPMPEKGGWPYADVLMGDGWSIAYRTFDAQYWGVPQRRRRIYLVADFAGQSAKEILFEPESMSGDTEQGKEQGKETACHTGRSIDGTGRDGCKELVLNDQGGQRMDVTMGVTQTLRATANHPPLVFENHAQDSRYTGPLDKSQTVLATFGTGGNNQPFVVENFRCFDVRFTSLGTQNKRHNCYETKTARTIDTGGNAPDSNQGGVAVVSLQGSMIGRSEKNGPQGDGINKDVSFTLNTVDRHAVVYALDRVTTDGSRKYKGTMGITDNGVNPTLIARGPTSVGVPTYSMTTGSFAQVNKEKAPTLAARDYKDAPIVNAGQNPRYIVRRLTPTECARLQGFPDSWCSNLGTENTTMDELRFWYNVFADYGRVMGKKPKSLKAIKTWLKNPHSDSAEYKMWGNGLCLNIVAFILQRIQDISQI